MSFLAGMLDTQTQAAGMSAQRDRNALYERKQLLDEQERAFAVEDQWADDLYKRVDGIGGLDINGTGLGQGFVDKLKDGGKVANDIAIDVLNRAGIVEGGGRVVSLERDNARGGYMATVRNPDGSVGALTKDPQDSSNSSEMLFISDADVLENANSAWNIAVVPHTSEINMSEARRGQRIVELEDDNFGATISAEEKKQNDYLLRLDQSAVLNNFPEGGARREAAAVLQSAKDPEEKKAVLAQMAEDLQIELPSATTANTPTSTLGTTTAAAPTAAAPTAAAPTAAAPTAAVGNNSLYDAVEQVESGGDHSAVSPAGATGVMQLMPETAKNPGFGIEPVKDDSEEENRRVGREYLDALLGKYDGNLDHALAAYNYGPGNIDEWIANGADPKQLPQETQDYLVKVRGAMKPQQAPVSGGRTPRGTGNYGNEEPSAAPVPDGFDPEINYTDDELRVLINERGVTAKYSSGDATPSGPVSRGGMRRGPSTFTKFESVRTEIQEDLKNLSNNKYSDDKRKIIEDRLEENKEKFTAMVAKNNAPLEKTPREQLEITRLKDKLDTKLTDAERKKTQAQLDVATGVKPEEDLRSDEEPVQAEYDAAAAMMQGKTAREIADMAISGEIILSDKSRIAIARRLKAIGVKKIEDLRELSSNKDLALALVAMAATVKGEANKGRFYTEARNVMESGVRSMSAKDAGTAAIDSEKLRINLLEVNRDLQALRRAETTDAEKIAGSLIENVREVFTDNLNKETADAFMKGGKLNRLYLEREKYDPGTQAREMIDKALNAAVSQVAASYAAEENSWNGWEIFESVFRGDASSDSAPADFNLNRVIESNGKIYYTSEPTVDPATGVISQAPLDQAFDLKDLLKVSPQLYQVLEKAAKSNTALLLQQNGSS